MLDEPSGTALLDVARRALLEDVAPALSGRPRFVALMVVNALGIAARDLGQAQRLADAWAAALAGTRQEQGEDEENKAMRRLAKAIRSGACDADPVLYYALMQASQISAEIWKPAKPAGV